MRFYIGAGAFVERDRFRFGRFVGGAVFLLGVERVNPVEQEPPTFERAYGRRRVRSCGVARDPCIGRGPAACSGTATLTPFFVICKYSPFPSQ
jgi:hypothetical protein